LTPVLLRAAQNYALNHLEHWLASHSFRLFESDRGSPQETGNAPAGESEEPTVRFRDRR
jgi:hypothetical protein